MHSDLFTPVLAASGLMNFFGEGYWYHWWYKRLFLRGFSLNGVTFVSKTTTLNKREGNMPLQEDGITPRDRKPACIWSSVPIIGDGLTVNAVGLSGPGVDALLAANKWQERTSPFWISFMPVADDPGARLTETKLFVAKMLRHKHEFQAEFGIQFNGSCPNQKGMNPDEAISEAHAHADALAELDVPVMYKGVITTSPEQIKPVAEHPVISALCFSNALAFGQLPNRLPWRKRFRIPKGETPAAKHSPLFKKVGQGGGLSGPWLLPLVIEWIKEARALGVKTHINAGGGIFSRKDVRSVAAAGADSISIGSVAIHRPHRLAGIVQEAREQFD